MMKKTILTFLFVLMPFFAWAGQCKEGDLALEFLDVKTFAPTDAYTAQLMGSVDVPTPNYTYTFLFAQEEMKEGLLKADLGFYIKEPDIMSAQVITPLRINSTIQIPHRAKTLMIDVVKRFRWGPEYFKLELPETPAFSPKLYCMSPEQYKE